MSDLVLYNYFRSSTSYRARIALHHKGLKFEYKPVHLLNNGGEQHDPQYRQMNPAGEVPTLIHHGKAIGQSMAIIQYLDQVFHERPLFPSSPLAKAKVMQFCEGINCQHSLTNLKVTQKLQKDFHFSEDQKKVWTQHWMNQILTSSEKLLSETAGNFCFGNENTAADAFLIPMVFSAKRFDVDINPYPLISKVVENCLKLEIFQKAHPMNQPDTPQDLTK